MITINFTFNIIIINFFFNIKLEILIFKLGNKINGKKNIYLN